MSDDRAARIRAAMAQLTEALVEAVHDPETAAPEHLVSLSEAAATLGISRTRLYAEIAAGRVRTVQSGRRRLVPASELVAFVRGPS